MIDIDIDIDIDIVPVVLPAPACTLCMNACQHHGAIVVIECVLPNFVYVCCTTGGAHVISNEEKNRTCVTDGT